MKNCALSEFELIFSELHIRACVTNRLILMMQLKNNYFLEKFNYLKFINALYIQQK